MSIKSKAALSRKVFSNPHWDFDSIQLADEITHYYGKEYLKLDVYPNQIEVVTSEQMLDAYSLVGLPTSYPHWKFGKDFVMNQNSYRKGQMGLSYEMVINSNPCISYNMENNSTCLMLLVIAHACQGHNAFFKGNYMFRDWTMADAILDYMVFARDYVLKCEEEFGYEEVEATLDACHALMNLGVDKYKKPEERSVKEENERLRKLVEFKRETYNELWKTIPSDTSSKLEENGKGVEMEENILYYIEKNAPRLPVWKRELIRIVRKVSQYFYPQSQTKVMNEGFATFTHYHLVNKLHEEGFLEEGFMLEFLHHHSSVVFQPPYSSKYFNGLNPYTLGFNIFMDLKRICEHPTAEDREWFPSMAGKDWLEQFHFAMENFRDDSFLLQYLSPKVMRDMKLFAIRDDEKEKHYEISAIHNERGYKKLREYLSSQYSRSNYVPDIQVEKGDIHESNVLKLIYNPINNYQLNDKEAEETLDYVRYLWGFPVHLYRKNKLGVNQLLKKSY
ncbi:MULTISPECIES: SpoVR family protein [Persicobacter]|uniref:SpoVR family protein n=1 Tax=Persicobacter diffluens TaxID=981 RepID=A0AAN5AHR6_9BACT|nr:SpoVR family protein [Persicobacter sp. CCB-QB2]GJM59575.1 SpoVR family protein [Persicobacter diffluens]